MAEKPEAEKFTHAEVKYESPSRHEGKFCILCEHFIPARPPRCEGVKSPIRAGDYCKRFEAK
jgi:hypothetical protein